ncbi:MAG TPA: DUF1566 domain-containing protein [Bacteroidales bacterium]|nr:DUF1566 domain-containing protein [Bacteroidales bacterium]
MVAIFVSATLWAQSPERISYQAVVRNSSDVLVANTKIGMEINIRHGSSTGTIVYTETLTPTTNANGLVSIEIGKETSFNTINWADGPYFIETKTAIESPLTSYTITSTSQLLSVPYALHAKTAENISGVISESDPIFTASAANTINASDINNWNNKLDIEKDSSITNEIQGLSIGHDTIFLSNGGYVKLPAGFDGQYSSLTGTPSNVSSFVNDAGYLTIEKDSSITNEIQVLSIGHDTVFLSNGGFVKLPGANGSETKIISGSNTSITGNGTTTNPYVINSTQTSGNQVGQMQYWDGTAWVTITAGRNGQVLSFKNGIPTWTWEDKNINDLSIGDYYQGGIIVYFLQAGDIGYDTNVKHGIIAAPYDQSSSVIWGCYGSEISGADSTSFGSGYQNTLDILAGCSTQDIAARICDNLVIGGYNDWYLPSKDELNKVYLNKDVIGGFSNNNYWTSSEYNLNIAWIQNMGTGQQSYHVKHMTFKVRAIRSF